MIVLGLGSNLGSREAYLRAAELLLRSEVEITARSGLYVTPPLGPPQPDYLNAALRIEEGELDPRDVLGRTQSIENALGRRRRERWGPRVIDIDLLFWSGGTLEEPGLQIPHAGLPDRAFAIAPLLDVAPELRDRYTCEAPPQRPWSSAENPPRERLDRLAFETSAALGGPPAAPVREVDAFTELPARGPAWITLERWDELERRGAALR